MLFPQRRELHFLADKEILCQLTMLLHHLQELDDDLRARADEDLSLARLLGVVDGRERIVEY